MYSYVWDFLFESLKKNIKVNTSVSIIFIALFLGQFKKLTSATSFFHDPTSCFSSKIRPTNSTIIEAKKYNSILAIIKSLYSWDRQEFYFNVYCYWVIKESSTSD